MARNGMMAREQRNQAEARKGWLIVAVCALAFVAMVAGVAMVDASQGVSAAQSLTMSGL